MLASVARDGKFNYTADCRRSLVLDHWIEKVEISAVLESSADGSVEVFWKTSARKR